jgi:adenosylcobyric acid synthase
MSALMIQGCGSDVGKSVLVAGLCRLFVNRGLSVRPFKSQNMSNNAAVTPDGGEIGRAQALQAQACRVAATVDMNPVLLKPQSDVGAQLIVHGRLVGTLDASAHGRDKQGLLNAAIESYRRLEAQADLVIVEGAGSPAETNLRRHDIANMGLAQALDLPVILVGDINRGHVIASLVGAHVVLDAADRGRIRGFIVNKFRGDPGLFTDGMRAIVDYTGWLPIGLVPWLRAASRLPSEDGVQLETGLEPSRDGRVKIVIPLLARIANFDEFDPLRAEPNIDVIFVPPGRPLPVDAALIILPGTKATIGDLEFLRAQGWDIDILSHVRRGGRVLGVCGGYQMLGQRVSDPDGVEGAPKSVPGLGLLDVETTMTAQKTLREVSGVMLHALSAADMGGSVAFAGYEMHVGSTIGPGNSRPLLRFADGTPDGAVSHDGRVAGCYVHGLFAMTAARSVLVSSLGAQPEGENHSARVDAALEEIAGVLASCLDIDSIINIARA